MFESITVNYEVWP